MINKTNENLEMNYYNFLNADFNNVIKTLELCKIYDIDVPFQCMESA